MKALLYWTLVSYLARTVQDLFVDICIFNYLKKGIYMIQFVNS